MDRADSERILVGAGLLVWGVAGLPQIAAWASGRAPLGPSALVWCAAYGTFLVAFLSASAWGSAAWRPWTLALQSAAALVVVALGDTGFEGAMLCIVAGEAPLLVGEKSALIWVAAQAVGMAIIDFASPLHIRGNHFPVFAYAGFQAFAFGASRIAVRAAAGRAELARVHAELLATRELFADSTRTAERLRIARELHDALGHHLSALSLQLELARNLADGNAKEPVEQAHAVTRKLLAELRTVVTKVREEVPLDLVGALRKLVAGIPRPRVHLQVHHDLRVDAALAHTIFRCVQEALTNAVRHAGADNMYLTIETRGETVTVTARDDGRGAARVHVGHGLVGLRERIEEMGGKVEIEAQQGAGLTLRALLPARAGSS